ncbi:ATP-binding protein [Methylophaga thalassica]|jgi:ABC-type bacteriocin/lantibiotic exporter with double-glycine peptidase domain|uniref:ATP-binding protein n=1 Tax=Methylophaga thalassica TaxID=40223 RepID=UPI002E7BB43E|nr:ATP-binding protein [Methylophaga thalassica]WVI83887.1 ATP-binding protein [Methylophaga thalassica]
MILKNKYFHISVFLVLVQQLTLGASTFFLAKAGAEIAEGNTLNSIYLLTYFFVFALVSYIASSLTAINTTIFTNCLWKKYILMIFDQVKNKQNINLKKNKQNTTAWLIGEAPQTLREVAGYMIGTISVYLSVITFLTVFYFTIGAELTALISASLLLSIIFVSILRRKIEDYASSSQTTRLMVNTFIPSFWDAQLNVSAKSKLLTKSKIEFENLISNNFRMVERYTILEQFLATLPIIISVIILISAINNMKITPELSGMLLALLPRTLQFFGSVHSISIANSKFIYLRSKYKRLLEYVGELYNLNLKGAINNNKILIQRLNDNKMFSVDELLDIVLNDTNTHKGRILIEGENGAGKSALLHLIKEFCTNSILMTPDTKFSYEYYEGSTGQNQQKEIETVIQSDHDLFLMDEWDSNLDKNAQTRYDKLLDELSSRALVLEVRH